MRFETKAFTVLAVTLVVGLSVINFLSVVYLKIVLEEALNREVDMAYKLYALNNLEPPEYIKIKESPTPPEGYRVAVYTGRHFIFVEEGYVQKKLKSFAVSLLIWEVLLVISVLILFRKVVINYIRREKEVKDIMNILLLAITHRIGNFISAQKINLELLEDSPAVNRLRESVKGLEEHYSRTLGILELLGKGQGLEPVRVDLEAFLRKVIRSLHIPEGVRVRVRTSKVYIKTNPVYLEILLTSLIENALKYARSRVYVRLCNGERRPLLIVRNDVREHSGGSGMGLQIVKFTAEKMGASVRFRVRDRFTAVVVF